MHNLSIVTVNWKADDFLAVLRESVELFTSSPYEFIVIDNSTQNRGHGEGMNLGAAQATGQYVMFVDVDCHFLRPGWDLPLVTSGLDIIAGEGVPEKPIRPACLFLRADLARRYDWSATPGYKGHRVTPDGFDVAIRAYHQMVADGVSIKLLSPRSNRYGTLNGEEWWIDGQPILYHHWHGSHLTERSVDFPGRDLFADKEVLFSKIPWRAV